MHCNMFRITYTISSLGNGFSYCSPGNINSIVISFQLNDQKSQFRSIKQFRIKFYSFFSWFSAAPICFGFSLALSFPYWSNSSSEADWILKGSSVLSATLLCKALQNARNPSHHIISNNFLYQRVKHITQHWASLPMCGYHKFIHDNKWLT